jgi:uncharacterized protein (TIGR03086 family)
MGPKLLLQRALEHVSHCLKHVRSSQLDNPTPCSQWNLRQLLNHITYETLWIPDMVRGKTIPEVGKRYEGDVLGDDPISSWRHAATKALEAIRDADEQAMAHLSYGDESVRDYLMEVAGDILIHAWDVGQALHCTIIFDDSLTQAVYDDLLPNVEESRRKGLYGKKVEVPQSADLQTKLLALVGRSAQWHKTLAV